jgi:hypothetical protein
MGAVADYLVMRHRQGNRVNPISLVAAPAVALASLAAASCAAGEPPEWRKVDASTGRIADVPGLERLAIDFPDSASVRRRLLVAYLDAGMTDAGLQVAVELVRDGYVFTPETRDRLLSLGPTEAQKAALAWQEVNSHAWGTSTLVATVPAEFELVESAWRDPASGDLFATTVVSRALIVSRGGGPWSRLPLRETGSLTGMAYDEAARLLWVASGVFEQTPQPETAFHGLIAVDPESGEERRRIAAGADATPGDIAIGRAGEIYASDPLSGAIYLGRPDASHLELLVAPGTFRSPQGLAPLADGRSLVISDYGYGLALLDIAGGRVRRVAVDASLTIDGVDGLWRVGDRLVAIQNGSRPMHVLELASTPTFETVQAGLYRETATPAWTEPVGGTIVGNELVYVATGQWDRFGAGGATVPERPPLPTEIRTVKVGEESPPGR